MLIFFFDVSFLRLKTRHTRKYRTQNKKTNKSLAKIKIMSFFNIYNYYIHIVTYRFSRSYT